MNSHTIPNSNLHWVKFFKFNDNHDSFPSLVWLDLRSSIAINLPKILSVVWATSRSLIRGNEALL
jgi:hypothetical protein